MELQNNVHNPSKSSQSFQSNPPQEQLNNNERGCGSGLVKDHLEVAIWLEEKEKVEISGSYLKAQKSVIFLEKLGA